MNSSDRAGGATPIAGPSTTAATASGTPASGPPRSPPSATASWASRISAPRWLAVNAAERSGSTVSMSAPATPRAEIETTAAPPARARSTTSVVYRFVPRWLSRTRPSSAAGRGPDRAASIACTAHASTPAARRNHAPMLAACQLVPVPTSRTRRPRSRHRLPAAGAARPAARRWSPASRSSVPPAGDDDADAEPDQGQAARPADHRPPPRRAPEPLPGLAGGQSPDRIGRERDQREDQAEQEELQGDVAAAGVDEPGQDGS